MTKAGVSALLALWLMIVGSWFYGRLGAREGIAWAATDAVCAIISLMIGVPMLRLGGLSRAVGIALMNGVAGLVWFHVLALPIAGMARTTHPGWHYLNGYNGALWYAVGIHGLGVTIRGLAA